jgi:hypothetical protein
MRTSRFVLGPAAFAMLFTASAPAAHETTMGSAC